MAVAKEERTSLSRAEAVGLGLALAFGAAFRLWDLDRLPGEIYGDIVLLMSLLEEIVTGAGRPRFLLSAGPLYPVLVAPIVAVFGTSYFVLKLLTAGCGLAAAAATGWLAREAFSTREAVVTVFVAAVSSWLLVFSRLGNLQVLSPLLVAVTLALALRGMRTGSAAAWLAAGLVSTGGFFCYPSTFVLPPLVLALQLVSLRGRGARGAATFAANVSFVIAGGALAFRMMAAAGQGTFDGYVLAHAVPEGEALGDAFGTLWRNGLGALGMLHVRGDEVFRSNPPERPHLDPVSGLCCLVGIVAPFLARDRRRAGLLLAAAYLVLLAPSALVLAAPREVPSASRALGAAPIAYLWVGAGIVAIGGAVSRAAGRSAGGAVIAILLGVVAVWNARVYFVDYARNLPDGNVAFGREIAAAIDELPAEVSVSLLGCCWGAWGQPEPAGITHALRRPRSVTHRPEERVDCGALLRARPTVVFMDPRRHDRIAAVEGCLQSRATIKRVDDVDVFAVIDSRRSP